MIKIITQEPLLLAKLVSKSNMKNYYMAYQVKNKSKEMLMEEL